MVHELAALVGPQFCNWKERKREREIEAHHTTKWARMKDGVETCTQHTMIAISMNANGDDR